jgi:hypothetical protein
LGDFSWLLCTETLQIKLIDTVSIITKEPFNFK